MFIGKFVWFRSGLKKFFDEVNADAAKAGTTATLVSVERGLLGLRYLIIVYMPAAPDPDGGPLPNNNGDK